MTVQPPAQSSAGGLREERDYRLLVLDRRTLTRDCMVAAFADMSSSVQIVEAASPDDAVGLLNKTMADVALVNLASDDFDESSLAQLREALRSIVRSGAIVLMSMLTDRSHMLAAARQGIVGFLPGDTSIETTLEIVSLARLGWTVYPTQSGDREPGTELIFAKRQPTPADTDFTPRQRQVLSGLIKGYTNASIAADLGISERAVKLHVQKLMQALGVSNRTQVVARIAGVAD